MGWEEWRNRLLKKYLFWRGNPNRIRRFLKRTNKDISKAAPVSDTKIKVAAMQLEMSLYEKPLDFVAKMNSLTRQAVKEGVRLLVLPEDNLTQLIGLLPGISSKNRPDGGDVNELLADLGPKVKITDILGFIGPVIKEITQATFSELARIFGIYIMSGSGMLPGDDNKIYNIAYLFGSDGRLLAEQKKTHLLPLEIKWGLKTGDKLEVVDTEIGKLAFPICMDATYFETFRIVSWRGAEIVMLPIANPDPDYNYWTALRGIWGRVQESKVYGIKSAMVGNFLGFQFTGQSGIYGPLEITSGRNGIIAEAKSFDREEMVIAELDLNALVGLKDNLDSTRELWEKYFPQAYYFI